MPGRQVFVKRRLFTDFFFQLTESPFTASQSLDNFDKKKK
jgi:hypothetical protein